VFLAIVPKSGGKAQGYASYMRMDPANGVIEVGNILMSPTLQRTSAATEAMYLMARHVFEDLGYRRYEWKCNANNAPSRRAALRYGFTFEGIFRQHMIVKGRNRDTAWFSMLDSEWPARKAAFEAWLDPANFDAESRQRRSLGEIGADLR
jgi:RimJ/RimL family protein N-acetyltransferase